MPESDGNHLMRPLLLLALAVLTGPACSGEPQSESAASAPTERIELPARPENTHAYAAETLSRFRDLIQGEDWRAPAWNAQGTLEVTHVPTGLTLLLVPGGSFHMGSRTGPDDERPRHRVATPAFLLSKTECPQAGWDRVGGEDSRWFKGADLPIESVSWIAAREWCERVGLRLPSESEWEFACRAGSVAAWCFGDDASRLREYGWYFVNSGKGLLPLDTKLDARKLTGEWGCATRPVGGLKPNAFGLHDMHGNVWEWCEDTYHGSFLGAPSDGSARVADGTVDRVIRGGAWGHPARWSRSAKRGKALPGLRWSVLGFRPARSLPE